MRQVKRAKTGKNQTSSKKKSLNDRRLPQKHKIKKERKHPDFGTSRAEQEFAKNFLDKLGVEYIWQFEAKEIKRFYDFFLPDYRLLIEFDGTYWHSDERIYEEKDLNPMQKRNRRIDEEKNRWALLHGIPLIRIKEKDVNEKPNEVMKMLKERLNIQGNIMKKEKDLNKRHVNKLNG